MIVPVESILVLNNHFLGEFIYIYKFPRTVRRIFAGRNYQVELKM
jgi:hypothetical protein